MNDFHEIWYSSDDGLRLFARDYPYSPELSAQDITRPAPTVLCIPGLTRNSADFHLLCRQLQTRCRAIAVDLRGRGRSDYDSEPANYHPGIYVQDVLALIEHLGLGKLIFIGTSLGGLVSMLIGASHPDLVEALVLNDFAPELQSADLERIKSYVGKAPAVSNWAEAVAQSQQLNRNELPDLSEEEWLAFTRNLYQEDSHGRPVLAYDPAIAESFGQTEGAPDSSLLWTVFDALPADAPLLLIRGALSQLLAPGCIEEMQRRHRNFNWVEVPNRGHAPLLNEPMALEAINDLLLRVRLNSL